jgi:hypothetical protein
LTQVADFDPGIFPYPEGLFWTVPLEPDDVRVDLEQGTASLRVRGLHVFNYFNIPNALFHTLNPVNERATVSFRLDWIGPVTNRRSITDAAHRFKATMLTNQARMEWSARNEDGSTFVSDPERTSMSVFSEIGRDKNGVFFSDEGGAGDSEGD